MGGIQALLSVQGTMVVFLILGVICRKTGIINEHSEESMSAAIVNIVFPCLIFDSMVKSMDDIVWADAGVAILVSIGVIVFSFVFGRLVFCRFQPERRAVLSFGALVSNASFVGLPLVSSIYGEMGLLYTTIYMTVSRVAVWTAGVRLFPGGERKNPIIMVLTNPNTIAMILAVIYYLLPFQLPKFIMSAVSEVGDTLTLFCMAMVGSITAGVKLHDFLDPAAYFYCLVRLLVLPLITLGVLKLLQVDTVILGSMVILVSAPAPTLCSVLAIKYGADKYFASVVVLLSTVLSMITVPLLAMLYV